LRGGHRRTGGFGLPNGPGGGGGGLNKTTKGLRLGRREGERWQPGAPPQKAETPPFRGRRASSPPPGGAPAWSRPPNPFPAEGIQLAYRGLGSYRRGVNPTVFDVLCIAHLPRGCFVFGCVPNAVAARCACPPELFVVELEDAIEVQRRKAPGRHAHLTLPLH